MKIKDGFVLKEIAGTIVVVPVGNQLVDFSSMITFNSVSELIWRTLEKGASAEDCVNAVLDEYDADSETVKADVAEFIALLKTHNLLDV